MKGFLLDRGISPSQNANDQRLCNLPPGMGHKFAQHLLFSWEAFHKLLAPPTPAALCFTAPVCAILYHILFINSIILSVSHAK